MIDKWKSTCGKLQVVLGIISFAVSMVAFLSFVNIKDIVFNSDFSSSDFILGFGLLIYGIFISALCFTFGFINIENARKIDIVERTMEECSR